MHLRLVTEGRHFDFQSSFECDRDLQSIVFNPFFSFYPSMFKQFWTKQFFDSSLTGN